MFSIGFPELVLVMVVGLLVLGPEKLPEVARMIAKAMRDVRKYGDEVRREFERNVLTEDLDSIKKDIQSVTHEVTDSVMHDYDIDRTDHGDPCSSGEVTHPHSRRLCVSLHQLLLARLLCVGASRRAETVSPARVLGWHDAVMSEPLVRERRGRASCQYGRRLRVPGHR